MEIRFLSEQDSLHDVSAVYERSWRYAYKGIIPQFYLDAIPAGRWADGSLREKMSNLVAVENRRIIGTLGFCKSRWEEYDGYGEIVSVYLLPEYIGRGYGGALLSRAVKELREFGFRRILLWVLEDNIRARGFYEKFGFAPREKYMRVSFSSVELREQLYIKICLDE